MATSDQKLSAFLSYLNGYLHSYRKKYNKSAADCITLRFLVGNTDTITIYCSLSDPGYREFKVGDFWYSGSVLRKCKNLIYDDEDGVIRSYEICYFYADAFASSIVSLNPALNNGAGNGHIPENPNPNPETPGSVGSGSQILSGGGTMTGPLYLRERILDSREAVSKSYVDNLIAQQQQTIFDLNQLVNRIALESSQTISRLEQIQRDFADVVQLKTIRVSKTVPAIEWPIVHNHNSRYAIVQVYDFNGSLVIPDSVEIVNENAICLRFSIPIMGRAIVFLPKE